MLLEGRLQLREFSRQSLVLSAHFNKRLLNSFKQSLNFIKACLFLFAWLENILSLVVVWTASQAAIFYFFLAALFPSSLEPLSPLVFTALDEFLFLACHKNPPFFQKSSHISG